ncbi:Ubiquitin carboxyl-terminal hydrolase 36 [Frankliniella fusca]|uniref:ubiquitinyl hydrolase 1 n=1 Tax=Frankliniella fusca TaxID=407009 RepID=A0AAE1HIZ2_9NEOP|nr:Ubiquitin carboxyl-terminal hydrolase 36 [Frankliniella fusca]
MNNGSLGNPQCASRSAIPKGQFYNTNFAFILFILVWFVLVDDVAAALASYAYSRNTNKTVVMVDSGAGGSSVAVASVKGNQVHLLQLSRLHLPGGDHFDSIMVDFIKDRILRNMNVRVSSTRDNIILRQYWEEAKRKLSRIPSTAIKAFLPDAYVEVNEEVSRLDFEGVCHDLIVSIVNEVMKTVTTSEVNEEDIQNVVLLGGSARVPHLRHLLQTALNRANISLFDPDEAVAKGLVLIGNFQVEISQQWVEKKSSWFTGCPLISSSLSPHKPYEDADQIDEGISMYVGFPLIAQDASAGNPTTVQDGRSPSVTGAREGDTQHLSMKTTSPEPWTEHRDVENSRPKSACSSAHSHVGRESQFSDKLGGETPLQFSPQRDDSDDLLHPDVEGCSSKPFGSESPFSDMLGSETPLEGCPPPDDNHDAPNRDAQKCSDQLDRTSRNDDIDSDLQTDNKATAETEKKITEREGQYQVDLNEVLLYRKTRRYPSRLRGKCNRGNRKNFRRQCNPYSYNPDEDKLYYHPDNKKKKNIEIQTDLINKREVVLDKNEQLRLIKMFHEGTDSSLESASMGSHIGRDRLVRALKERYYWQTMYSQAERYCQLCITCKTINPASLKVSDVMHPVGVPTRHMAQLGIDLSQMPEVDGMKYFIVAIDYFTKWVEAEAIPDKSMGTVASDTEDDDPDPFDMEKFKESLRPMDRFREEIDLAVEGNIKKAQDRQRRGYNKRHAGGKILKEGDEVFLINQRRRDRKGGNYEMPRSGPYIIVEISDRKNVTLKNKNGLILKNKYPLLDLEPYIIPPEREMKRATRPDTGGGDEKKGSTHEHEDAIQHTDKSNSEIQNNKIDANDTDEEVDTQKPVLLHQYTIDTDTDDTDKGVDIQKPVILNQNTIDTDDTDEEVQTQKPVLNYPREIGKEELNEFLKMEESTEILCIKGYKITTAELLMIHDKHWLNDMIINAYFDIICEVTNKGKVHFLSTFFMQKLSSSLSEAQKWTKNVSIYSKVNIFEFKTLLVPIHGRSNTHWSLCAIDNDEHSITYFDSLRCNVREESDAEMEAIHNFLKAEYSRKGNGLLPPYSKNYAQNPYQTDSCDCGVFVCFFGRRLAEGRSCQAPSSHISNMRQQMAVELLAAKLLPENSWKVTLHEFVTSDGLDVSYSVKAQSGIQNLGNTCFISATLQLLFHCEPLLKVLKAAAPLADAKTITKELITAYDEYCNGNVLVPSELVKVVTGVLPRYRSGRQYDAEEFLNFLLQHISGEFEECARTFQATMNVKVTCQECHFVSVTTEEPVMLSTSISMCRSVQDCVKYYFQEECVSDYKCVACSKKVSAIKAYELTKAPDVLLIQLKRFTADGKKVSNVVRQNMRLKASEVGYDFVGAISHLGASGASGHYVATVKVADKLIHFDDDKKTVSSMQKLNKEQAYVVMYCKTAEKKY